MSDAIMKRITYTTAALGAVAALGAAVTYADELWYRFGWRSPAFVAAEHESIAEAFEAFTIEWRCSEWYEEREKLQTIQQNGDNSPELFNRIDALTRRINNANCERFEL